VLALSELARFFLNMHMIGIDANVGLCKAQRFAMMIIVLSAICKFLLQRCG
jgi:hypothetical protein